jgi:hypothetical protein
LVAFWKNHELDFRYACQRPLKPRLDRRGSFVVAGTLSAASPSSVPATIDVIDIRDNGVAKKGEKLEWRTSTFDLDSSSSARKELAAELKYSGTRAARDRRCLDAPADDENPGANGGKLPSHVVL